MKLYTSRSSSCASDRSSTNRCRHCQTQLGRERGQRHGARRTHLGGTRPFGPLRGLDGSLSVRRRCAPPRLRAALALIAMPLSVLLRDLLLGFLLAVLRRRLLVERLLLWFMLWLMLMLLLLLLLLLCQLLLLLLLPLLLPLLLSLLRGSHASGHQRIDRGRRGECFCGRATVAATAAATAAAAAAAGGRAPFGHVKDEPRGPLRHCSSRRGRLRRAAPAHRHRRRWRRRGCDTGACGGSGGWPFAACCCIWVLQLNLNPHEAQ